MTERDNQAPAAGTIRRRGSLAFPYAFATVLGAVFVFVSKDFWWVPIVAMLVYMVLGLENARRQGMVLEFADSFYYLGFTLTIASLLASLEPFRGLGAKTSDVLRYFGLGLFTTLIGIVGRTVLQMFYRTPSETIGAVNQQIEDAARDYLGTLDELHKRSRQLLEQTLGALASTLEGELTEVRKALTALHKAIQSVAAKVGNVDLDTTALTRAFTGVLAAVEAAHKDLKETIDAVAATEQELTERLRAVGTSADSSLREGVGRISTGLAEAARALDELSVRLRHVQIDARPLDTSMQAAAAAITASSSLLREGFAGLSENAASASGRLEELGRRVSTVDVESLREALAGLRTSVAELRDGTVGGLETLRSDVMARVDVLLRETLSEAERLNQILDEIIAAIRTKLEQIQ